MPRKGMVVTLPTVEGMREIYEIIEGLEGQAVKLAVRRADADVLRALGIGGDTGGGARPR